MGEYEDYVARKEREHGARFDPSALDDRFSPYYGTGQRIRVQYPGMEPITGTVGVTTGWKPAFLLMRRSSDHGSSWILDNHAELLAVQYGRTYMPVPSEDAIRAETTIHVYES